jgi:hypothetical protein
MNTSIVPISVNVKMFHGVSQDLCTVVAELDPEQCKLIILSTIFDCVVSYQPRYSFVLSAVMCNNISTSGINSWIKQLMTI